MDCSTPGSSVHHIVQARILEWVAVSFSWGASHPALAHGLFTTEPPGKPSLHYAPVLCTVSRTTPILDKQEIKKTKAPSTLISLRIPDLY